MHVKISEYKPFPNISGFYFLELLDSESKYLVYSNHNVSYSIDISDMKYIPKSGLLLCDFIEQKCFGKDVLDIGTGYGAILAKHSEEYGANSIDAIDIDQDVIAYLGKNKLSSKINFLWSDKYSKLENRKYDLIISNPPQMPYGSDLHCYHDIGGELGYEVIDSILKDARLHLKQNGCICLLLFGYLGITSRSNVNCESIAERFKKYGLEFELVRSFKFPARKGGGLERYAGLIERMYPEYKFPRIEGILYNEIYIVMGR